MRNLTLQRLAVTKSFASHSLSKHYTLFSSAIHNTKKIDIKNVLKINPKNYDGTSGR